MRIPNNITRICDCGTPFVTSEDSDNTECAACANQWTGGIVKCDLCNHEWAAVYHLSSERLECPNCSNMVTIEVIKSVY